MTSKYEPDGWKIIKLEKEGQIQYRVFASWPGGYADGDSWQINSGVKGFEEDSTSVKFYGYSGSIYDCRLGGEDRISAYNSSVLTDLIRSSMKSDHDISVTTITYEQFKKEFENGRTD